jgi:hypothetical protein
MKKSLFWERLAWILVLAFPAMAGSFTTTIGTAQINQVLSAPGPIGNVTPNTGTFSTLASPSVNLTGGTIGSAVTGGAGFGKPGWVFDFSGTTCPAGTLKVGTTATTVSRTTYANLFAAIGTTWGAGDGSTTFGIPSIPADYGVVQANANVGTSTVGSVISHTHSFSGSGSWQAYGAGSATNELGANYGNGTGFEIVGVSVSGTVGSTGGSANLGAGVRFLKCIQY